MAKKKDFRALSFKSYRNNAYVFGKSTIDQNIRVRHNLTCEEYVFLDFLKTFQDLKDTRVTQSYVWIYTGIRPLELEPLMKQLQKKGYIYKDTESGVVTTSQIWDDEFETKGKFLEFWTIAPKGNKNRAKTAYFKSIKIITPEELTVLYRKYVKWCDTTGTFRMHTSTWLNPIDRNWENQLDSINVVKGKEDEIKKEVLPGKF